MFLPEKDKSGVVEKSSGGEKLLPPQTELSADKAKLSMRGRLEGVGHCDNGELSESGPNKVFCNSP